MKDPLIVTLDGSMARLGDDVTSFDLDVDGTNDRVRLTAGASSFLVRDLDGNGAITDGRELFGAISGDGFADLAALDDDGNGWIDEGDAAFAELSLSGPEGMRSLADAGVGAISVRSVASPFTITGGTAAPRHQRHRRHRRLDGARPGAVDRHGRPRRRRRGCRAARRPRRLTVV